MFKLNRLCDVTDYFLLMIASDIDENLKKKETESDKFYQGLVILTAMRIDYGAIREGLHSNFWCANT